MKHYKNYIIWILTLLTFNKFIRLFNWKKSNTIKKLTEFSNKKSMSNNYLDDNELLGTVEKGSYVKN